MHECKELNVYWPALHNCHVADHGALTTHDQVSDV